MEDDFETNPAITLAKKVACGHIYCIFNEKEDVFDKLLIRGDMAKNCPCGESWLNSIAKLITYAMRRSIWEGNTKEGIIKQLLNQRCPASVPNKEHIVSCSDAIAKCVLEYSKSRDLLNEKEEETTSKTTT